MEQAGAASAVPPAVPAESAGQQQQQQQQQQQLQHQQQQQQQLHHLKRKRSPSSERTNNNPPPGASQLSKAPKAVSSHLAINYLARQYNEDLPLLSSDDSLPSMLTLLNEYHGVLDRHESMACNLGARPLGPILIKRFERLFEGPPKVLKSHGKEGTTVTWLDVVEFAGNKPEQFTLGQMSEGVCVCQFYTKQCRVQISEEDFVLISSGIPQKLIPPQPIIEDEEKELGTLEILEKNLNSICQLADQVAARARQLRHRIGGRKQAILDRRASDKEVSVRATSPSNIAFLNGSNGSSQSPGFVAVNIPHLVDSSGGNNNNNNNNSITEPGKTGASPATHHELLSKFFTTQEQRARNSNMISNGDGSSRVPVSATAGSPTPLHLTTSTQSAQRADASTEPIDFSPTVSLPAAPQTTHGPSTTNSPKDNDLAPFKSEMISRMEAVKRGDRIIPPCDRCRRLHMDCVKNLTACQGCTKKHAKCSWKDVKAEELVGELQSYETAGSIEAGTAEREASVGHPPSGVVESVGVGGGGGGGGGDSVNPPNGNSSGNGVFGSDGSPVFGAGAGMAGARALAINAAAAAGLAAVAQASTAAMESEAVAQQHRNHNQPHHRSTRAQSPNMDPVYHGQSPNIQSHPPFQPTSGPVQAAPAFVSYGSAQRIPSPTRPVSSIEDTASTLKNDAPGPGKNRVNMKAAGLMI